jgi:hypothetical protein
LLLWYAGVSTKDRNATEHAVDYLTHLAKKARIKRWPGPARPVCDRTTSTKLASLCSILQGIIDRVLPD